MGRIILLVVLLFLPGLAAADFSTPFILTDFTFTAEGRLTRFADENSIILIEDFSLILSSTVGHGVYGEQGPRDWSWHDARGRFHGIRG